MKLFALAASLREGSNNQQLIELAVKIAKEKGVDITLVDYATVVAPNYNMDVQAEGFPVQAETFKDLFESHDGFLFSCPEYNYSIPGALKNALDWVSRYRPSPTAGKFGYLMSASPSMVGGNRGLWQTRIPLEVAGVILHPSMFSLASSHAAFNDDGTLKDEALQSRLEGEIETFLNFVRKNVE